jgi:UDP-N-acetylglucosamine--N-acetylmuramyl-(pentapeptide) pyrophosphoryl-undecaprenol N-acetylglucosamine transferase
VAFGEWIRRQHGDAHVAYLAGTRSLEREIYASARIEPHLIGIEGSPLGGRDCRKRWFQQVRGILQTRDCLREEDPDACLLFGGYVSLPALFLCRFFRIPALLHEQNARAGRVTRLAFRMGLSLATGFRTCQPFRSGTFRPVGVPVRTFIRLPRIEAWAKLGLAGRPPLGPVVCVLVGSLGSSAVTETIRALAARRTLGDWTFLILGGASFSVRETDNLYLLPRLWEPDPLFSLADLCVVRAGASTLSEMASLSIPSVVVPWSGAAEDHQRSNAAAFVSESGNILWDERLDGTDALEAALKKLHSGARSRRDASGQESYADMVCSRLWDALESVAGHEGRGRRD